MAKGEVDSTEQFLRLPQYFQHFAVIIPSVIDIFRVCVDSLSKSSAAGLLYVGKRERLFQGEDYQNFVTTSPI